MHYRTPELMDMFHVVKNAVVCITNYEIVFNGERCPYVHIIVFVRSICVNKCGRCSTVDTMGTRSCEMNDTNYRT